MYNTLDYIHRASTLANNLLCPSRKKLSTLMLYSTSLCNSRCKHCLVWAKRPVETMSKDKVVEIMQSRCISQRTTVGLEGGEFLLHPEAMEILEWFGNNHPKFDLLSNCLQAHRVIEAVRKYPPQRLYLSLDGGRETYLHMRGADGFDKVIQTIEACKHIVPISLMFTLSPYNTFQDMNEVINIARKYNIDIRIGIYNNIDFFNTTDKAHDAADKTTSESYSKSRIPTNVQETSENYDFLVLYEEWKKGGLKLNCYSIFDSLAIHPDGNVPICQNLDISLGNVNEKTLDEIYNGPSARHLQKQYAHHCNGCWINFHRKYDIVLLRSLEKLFPKPLIEIFYGPYRWSNDKKVTYRKLLKEYM
jgi:MoaA/NifB/PqqE/SkfB family radical SAM enzyme